MTEADAALLSAQEALSAHLLAQLGENAALLDEAHALNDRQHDLIELQWAAIARLRAMLADAVELVATADLRDTP